MSGYPTPELFRSFPELRERIPWVSLARATPVHRLARLESYLHAAPIWIKRDDQTSDVYGGDKARKFEFVFGQVLRHGARRVLSFGAVGSSHCLAVSAFSHHFHLKPILAMVRQRQRRNVQRILQIEHELGADLHRLDGGPAAVWRLGRSILSRLEGDSDSRFPHVLWPRRTARLGALGYVNAAYEIKRQINCGILPEPERIYVSVGTGSTLAGLALGCRLAGIGSHLVGVVGAHRHGVAPLRLAHDAARHLRKRTRRFPSKVLNDVEMSVVHHYAGGPSRETSSAQHAMGLLRDLENIDLDPSYSSRTMAAMIEDVRENRVTGPVLFWHIHPAHVYAGPSTLQAEALPREFREFFVAR